MQLTTLNFTVHIETSLKHESFQCEEIVRSGNRRELDQTYKMYLLFAL